MSAYYCSYDICYFSRTATDGKYVYVENAQVKYVCIISYLIAAFKRCLDDYLGLISLQYKHLYSSFVSEV